MYLTGRQSTYCERTFHYGLNGICTPKVKYSEERWQNFASLACQNSHHLTTFSPACRSRLLFLTNSSPALFSCRAGSWPVSWLSSATRAPSWAGRNLRRRKQLHRLQRLQRATLSTTGPDQRELNYRPNPPQSLRYPRTGWTNFHQR